MYFYGIGVPSNIKLAREWYQKAKLDQDTAKIIETEENKHGNVLKVDFNKKRIVLSTEDKASLGDVMSLFKLGLINFSPEEGEKPDYQKAFSYFLKAAEAGYLPAKFQVGYMYETGTGSRP